MRQHLRDGPVGVPGSSAETLDHRHDEVVEHLRERREQTGDVEERGRNAADARMRDTSSRVAMSDWRRVALWSCKEEVLPPLFVDAEEDTPSGCRTAGCSDLRPPVAASARAR